jgi:hypothetical protein
MGRPAEEGGREVRMKGRRTSCLSISEKLSDEDGGREVMLKPSPYWRHRLHRGLRDETPTRARSPAMVFAPHQDDETLGAVEPWC